MVKITLILPVIFLWSLTLAANDGLAPASSPVAAEDVQEIIDTMLELKPHTNYCEVKPEVFSSKPVSLKDVCKKDKLFDVICSTKVKELTARGVVKPKEEPSCIQYQKFINNYVHPITGVGALPEPGTPAFSAAYNKGFDYYLKHEGDYLPPLFNDLKGQLTSILEEKKQALASAASGDQKNNIEQVFKKMQEAVANTQLDTANAYNLCMGDQRNVVVKRNPAKTSITVCAASAMMKRDELIGLLAKALSSSIDPCSMDLIGLGSGFEPLRACLLGTAKASGPKNPQDAIDNFGANKNFPHCGKSVTAQELLAGHAVKYNETPPQQDQSNDVVRQYWTDKLVARQLRDKEKNIPDQAEFLRKVFKPFCEKNAAQASHVDPKNLFTNLVSSDEDLRKVLDCPNPKISKNSKKDKKTISCDADAKLGDGIKNIKGSLAAATAPEAGNEEPPDEETPPQQDLEDPGLFAAAPPTPPAKIPLEADEALSKAVPAPPAPAAPPAISVEGASPASGLLTSFPSPAFALGLSSTADGKPTVPAAGSGAPASAVAILGPKVRNQPVPPSAVSIEKVNFDALEQARDEAKKSLQAQCFDANPETSKTGKIAGSTNVESILNVCQCPGHQSVEPVDVWSGTKIGDKVTTPKYSNYTFQVKCEALCFCNKDPQETSCYFPQISSVKLVTPPLNKNIFQKPGPQLDRAQQYAAHNINYDERVSLLYQSCWGRRFSVKDADCAGKDKAVKDSPSIDVLDDDSNLKISYECKNSCACNAGKPNYDSCQSYLPSILKSPIPFDDKKDIPKSYDINGPLYFGHPGRSLAEINACVKPVGSAPAPLAAAPAAAPATVPAAPIAPGATAPAAVTATSAPPPAPAAAPAGTPAPPAASLPAAPAYPPFPNFGNWPPLNSGRRQSSFRDIQYGISIGPVGTKYSPEILAEKKSSFPIQVTAPAPLSREQFELAQDKADAYYDSDKECRSWLMKNAKRDEKQPSDAMLSDLHQYYCGSNQPGRKLTNVLTTKRKGSAAEDDLISYEVTYSCRYNCDPKLPIGPKIDIRDPKRESWKPISSKAPANPNFLKDPTSLQLVDWRLNIGLARKNCENRVTGNVEDTLDQDHFTHILTEACKASPTGIKKDREIFFIEKYGNVTSSKLPYTCVYDQCDCTTNPKNPSCKKSEAYPLIITDASKNMQTFEEEWKAKQLGGVSGADRRAPSPAELAALPIPAEEICRGESQDHCQSPFKDETTKVATWPTVIPVTIDHRNLEYRVICHYPCVGSSEKPRVDPGS